MIEDNENNTTNEQAIGKKTIKARNNRDQEIKDLKELLDNPAFRRFIWRMLTRFGMFRLSFTGNSQTFFNEGRRNEGLWLTSEIAQADPKAMAALMTENNETLKNYGGI